MTLAVDATAEIFLADNYANALLRELGMSARATCAAIHPALRAAESGLLALTGRDDGPAQMCPTPLAACADGAIAALRALAPAASLAALDGGALLGERAAAFGHVRAGSISAGGSCRLLRASDDWLAVNLARDADWELLPAWLESECTRDWKSLAAALCAIPVAAAVARGRLLGLPVAPLTPHEPEATTWLQRRAIAAGNKNNKSQHGTAPLVIDLSSLWAGPLCGHLLHMLGARVVKVESLQRPDGARAGPSHFFDLINAGKQSVALDLSAPAGREQLQQLLLRADIVIEASRPRALRQMDIVAEDVLAQNPALTWVSITGYGRDEPQASWIAFGDDAGVAAGLSQRLFEATGEVMFCGDAIADPLTGIHAALAAWAGYLRGGGELLSLSLRDVTAYCAEFGSAGGADFYRERYRAWNQVLDRSGVQAAAPRIRVATAEARPLGIDTQRVLMEFGISC